MAPETPSNETLNVRYSFYLENGETLQFAMRFKVPALTLQTTARREPPEWTRLEFRQCPHCPLESSSSPQCPLAANLVDVVDTFETGVATDEAEIIIKTDNRSYGRRGPLAQGISSMIGLIMVTSGCPYLDKLRPMAFTHLPFASKPETMYRSISMYLLAQYFIMKRGGQPDWLMQNYVKIFDDINVVNEHISQRLKTVCRKDANLNALTKLDCFASITAISIESNSMEEIENLFHAYLQQSTSPSGNSEPAIRGSGPNLSVALDTDARQGSGRLGIAQTDDPDEDDLTTLSIDDEEEDA